MCAAFLGLATVPAIAQQDAASGDAGDYKPPSRLIEKTPAAKAPAAKTPADRPAAQSHPSEGQPARRTSAERAGASRGGGDTPAQAAPQSAQKTVGLLTTIGDTFTVQTIGVTAFGNEVDTFPMAAWKVNDRVAAQVSALLKKNFRVKRIPISEKDLAAVDAPGQLFRDYDADLAGALSKLAAKQPADYYLFIHRGGSPFGSTNQSLSGLGVTRTDGVLGLGGGDFLHALSVLRVYDSQFKQLRIEHATIGQDTFMEQVKGPHLIVTEESERLPKEPPAAFAHPRARQIVLDLLDQSLAMTVPKLLAVD